MEKHNLERGQLERGQFIWLLTIITNDFLSFVDPEFCLITLKFAYLRLS